MYIAMNRFKIAKGQEAEFERLWAERESYLHEVPGFVEFHLLRGPDNGDHVLYASHTVWQSADAFQGWTTSEQFRKAHMRAGGSAIRDLYLGPPQFEGFEVVQAIGQDGQSLT